LPEHLFVYGTLRPALWPESLRPVLAGLRCLGEASLPGRLYDLGPHPAGVPDPASDLRIWGEVLELSEGAGVIEALDRYEDFDPLDLGGSLFLRVSCQVELSNGPTLACWTYAYNRDPGAVSLVPHGDYVRWLAERENE
jgi:gamma-glutamylcyclotransferase (GGCT)/AIG2-like uncharacterized protein YtfP